MLKEKRTKKTAQSIRISLLAISRTHGTQQKLDLLILSLDAVALCKILKARKESLYGASEIYKNFSFSLSISQIRDRKTLKYRNQNRSLFFSRSNYSIFLEKKNKKTATCFARKCGRVSSASCGDDVKL